MQHSAKEAVLIPIIKYLKKVKAFKYLLHRALKKKVQFAFKLVYLQVPIL